MLASELEASIRASTDHDTDTQISSAQIYGWANEELQVLRRKLVDVAPDLFTRVTVDFTIAPGVSSQDLAGAPLSLTDFSKVRLLERKDGTSYRPIPIVPLLMAGVAYGLSWHQRGTVVDLFPTDAAPGIYRAKYVTKPTALSTGTPGATVDVPDGAERILVESVSARVRVRMEEDPGFHLAAASRAWVELRDSLVRQYVSTPSTIVDLSRSWY